MIKKLNFFCTVALALFATSSANAQCPTITCINDITINVDAGTCGAVFNYTAPIGIDACDVSGNILFVVDGPNINTIEIPTELTNAGYNVTSVFNDHNNTTEHNTILQSGGLSAYDAIYWNASGEGGLGGVHSAATFTTLSAYVNAGGAIFITGYDAIASPNDPELITFMGGTSSTDGGFSGGATVVGSNSLTTGVTNIIGLALTTSGDHDGLNGLQPGTVGVASTGTSYGWTIRTLGAGEIAWVSSTASNSGSGIPFTAWSTPGSGYHEALLNFAFNNQCGAGNILFVVDGPNINTIEIPTELTNAGYNVTSVFNDHNNTTEHNTILQSGGLSAYDAIYWNASGEGGLGGVHSAATFTTLSAYVNAGGAIFITGYDAIASPNDPELITFMGGTSSTDGGFSGGATVVGSNSLTTGVTNIIGLALTTSGDHDGLNGLQPGTVGVASTGTSYGWTIRTLGAGEIAWVSSTASNSGSGIPFTAWSTPGSGYHEALLNFAFNNQCGSGGPVTTMTAGLADGATFPIGATTVTYEVVDNQGNNAQYCSFIVTVVDNEAPSPDNTLLTDFSETCEATVVAPTATDNCGVVITGVPDATFPISTFGTTVVTWTYTDALGNASSQTQNVIVNAVDSTVTPSGTTLTANLAGATYQWLDCDNGSAVIAGETNQSFSLASGSGNFAVEVSLNGCTDTSACYNLDYSNIVYSFNPYYGDMNLVDTTNFTFSQIALTSSLGTIQGVNGADTDPCGTVYVVFKPGSDRYLGTVDLASGVITEIGMLSDKVANIAFSKEGVLYGVTGDGATNPETLFTIDVATAAMTLVTALGNGDSGESIEFCPENNKLYHWSGYGNSTLIMEEIDLTTLNVTPISFSGSGASLIGNVGSSTYAGNGRFLCGEIYLGELWWIDTAGVVTAAASSYGEYSKGLVFEAVSSAMVENLNPGLDSICPNDTLTLVCNSDVVSATYLWYLDGTSTGITNPTLVATIGGSYNCVVSLACGDINSDTIEITQLNAPNVSISPSPTVDLCAGDSVMLSGASGGTLQWYLDGSPISGASSSSYYATASGDYNMIKTNSNGCSDSASLATSVVTITVDAGATQSGTSLTADANGLTYQWLDCDNGYAEIAGETNQAFNPTAIAGNYAVEVTNNGCADTSACFNVDFTGITDLSLLGLSIYPNPSADYFFVESVKSSLESIEILDNSGRIVYSNYQITDNKTQVDVTKLSRGLYLINLSGEFGRVTKAIIIQ